MRVLKRDLAMKCMRVVLGNKKEVLLAYLFGSVASKGCSLHDVDLAVLLKAKNARERIKTLADITVEASKALRVNEEKVNLVDMEDAPIALKYNILKYGVRIVGDERLERGLNEELLVKYPDLAQDLKMWMNMDSNPKVDESVMETRVSELKRNVEYLKTKILPQTPNAIASNFEKTLAMERALHRAIEAVLDTCRHLVSVHNLGLAESYGEYPKRLAEHGLMPQDLAKELMRLAGIRNILVHRYLTIKHDILYESVRNLVSNIYPKFMRWVTRLSEL